MARPKEFDTTEALDRAVEVFWSQGYEGTSLPDLLAAMQISRQSCYDTFGNKHALFIRALERFVDTTAGKMLGPLESPEAGLSDLKRHFDSMVEGLSEPGECRACLVANTAMERATGDPDAAAVVQAYHRRTDQALYHLLRNAQAAGEISAEAKPRQLARFLRATMQGMMVLAKSGASRAELRDVAQVTMGAVRGEN
jgi:TetR/AcrR family transcriptional repressor of nem operon